MTLPDVRTTSNAAAHPVALVARPFPLGEVCAMVAAMVMGFVICYYHIWR